MDIHTAGLKKCYRFGEIDILMSHSSGKRKMSIILPCTKIEGDFK